MVDLVFTSTATFATRANLLHRSPFLHYSDTTAFEKAGIGFN